MKKEIDYTHSLAQLVNAHGCERVAEQLGLTRAAIRAMLNANRHIFVKKIRGSWCYSEIKPWKHAREYIKPRDTRARSWRRGSTRNPLSTPVPKPAPQDVGSVS